MRLRDAIIDVDHGVSCGPLSAALITGRPVSLVERVFACFESDGVESSPKLMGYVLTAFGYRLSPGYVAPLLDEEWPPLWRVLRYCPDGPLLIWIMDEGESHWVVTHGWFIADGHTHGKWIAWSDYGVHADAPVASVWLVDGR